MDVNNLVINNHKQVKFIIKKNILLVVLIINNILIKINFLKEMF